VCVCVCMANAYEIGDLHLIYIDLHCVPHANPMYTL